MLTEYTMENELGKIVLTLFPLAFPPVRNSLVAFHAGEFLPYMNILTTEDFSNRLLGFWDMMGYTYTMREI